MRDLLEEVFVVLLHTCVEILIMIAMLMKKMIIITSSNYTHTFITHSLTIPPIYLDRFIFEYLDYASYGDEALEQFEYRHLFMGKDKASTTTIRDRDSRKEKKNKSEDISRKGLRVEDTDEVLRPGDVTKKMKMKKMMMNKIGSDTNRGFGLKKNT